MQGDLDANFPSSDIAILGINEVGQESANDDATHDLDLPWLQDVDADQNGNSDVWRDQWDVVWRDVVILNEQNEVEEVYNLTPNDLGQPETYVELRQMIVDVATAQNTAANDWQNRVEPLDVTSDMFISPVDAVTLINEINTNGAHELPPASGAVAAYFDPSGDGFVSARDALLVINHLNEVAAQAAAEGESPEGESQADALAYHGGVLPSNTSAAGVGSGEVAAESDTASQVVPVSHAPENASLAPQRATDSQTEQFEQTGDQLDELDEIGPLIGAA